MASGRRRRVAAGATQAMAMCMVIPRQLGDTDPEQYIRATFLKVPCLSHKPTHCILQSMYCRDMRAEAHADLTYTLF